MELLQKMAKLNITGETKNCRNFFRPSPAAADSQELLSSGLG